MIKHTTPFALVVGAAVLVAPSVARADDIVLQLLGVYVSPGIAWSWESDPLQASGVGFEISAGYHFAVPTENLWIPSLGLFYRGVTMEGELSGEPVSYGRLAAGMQVHLLPFGVELGYQHRRETPLSPKTDGFIATPFVSIGVFYAGAQVYVPDDAQEVAVSTNIALKFPLPWIAAPFALAFVDWNMPHGRPTKDDNGDVALAGTVAGSHWRQGTRPDMAALSAEDRALLCGYWTQAGREEHASVAAFSQLSLSLIALGAGPELLHAAHQAAIDEVRHAGLCFALASAYAERAIDPGPLPTGGELSIAQSPAALALASLVDGCFGEAVAAREAAAAASAASDEAVVEALTIIARDEASHAGMAWDVVAFCLELDRAGVRAALERAAPQLLLAGNQPDAIPPSEAARAHGVLSLDERHAIAREVGREVVERAAALA